MTAGHSSSAYHARPAIDVEHRAGGEAIAEQVDDRLRRRRVVASLTSVLVAPALVAQSDLICTMPARLAHALGDTVTVLPPPCEVGSFAVHMAWHARTDHDPAQNWLRRQILDSLHPPLHDQT